MPTPIQDGVMSPNSQAINLIAGLASGHVKVDWDEFKYLPTIHCTSFRGNMGNAKKKEEYYWQCYMYQKG